MFFIALAVLVTAASAYLVHQFASGTLASDAPTAAIAEEPPRETLKAA